MSSKRLLMSDSIPKKKARLSKSNSYFHITLQESGLLLKSAPEKCIASHETIHIVRNLKKNLEKHFNYPRNLSDFFSDLHNECISLDTFKYYLFPNIIRLSEDSNEEYPVSDSVMKILLSVTVLQSKLTEFIFEKAIDLAADNKCGSWIQMILKCFSSLDTIANTDKMSTNLINLLDVSQEKNVKLEIITAIPDIIGDQEHDNIAKEMSRILCEEQELIPAILDCLSYLCLSDEQYNQLQKKTLNLLMGISRCNYFPNFVKFLLLPSQVSDEVYQQAVKGLRNALGWPTEELSRERQQQIATSQVLTATAIRHSMIQSKVISSCWLKTISLCKEPSDCKPIDFIILLILYSVSEDKQRQVENLVRKQIKMNILKEELLDETFKNFKPILKENLRFLLGVSNCLLKTKADLTVQAFASHLYTLMFSELEECCQTIIAELLHFGLDSKQCVMSMLGILNRVSSKDMSVLKPHSVQILKLLDRMDDMTLTEVRAVMNLLCGLAYSYENSIIRDDIHMIIRKELGSSNPTVKVQGILAAVHAIKYLMVAESDDENTNETIDNIDYSCVAHLPDGDLRDAAQLIELISRSTRQSPELTVFFYDELTSIISSAAHINKNFLSWLTASVTNHLELNFNVGNVTDITGQLKLTMQYCLNEESEVNEAKAINIAGITLTPNSETCVAILSPLFQLVQTLHSKHHDNDLSSIDALLGCPVVMPKFDIDMVEDMDNAVVVNILDCLVHCVNWFRELLNAFASQQDTDLQAKILKRVLQVAELETMMNQILMNTNINYKSPVCLFPLSKYAGEQVERKSVKIQNNKQKLAKKMGQDDTMLPSTSKSQPTQSNMKNCLDMNNNIALRPLNLNLLHLVKINMTEDEESVTELTVQTLNFLLKCINVNIENVLISKIKQNPFLSKQESVIYDADKAEQCAKLISDVLPILMEHLKFVTAAIDKFIKENEEEIMFTSDLINYLSCLEYIYNLCNTFFKWIGFRNHEHNGLLKSSLRSVVNSSTNIVSLKELLVATSQKFKTHEKYCILLSTAVSLIDILQSLQSYSENKIIVNISRDLAEKFLSKQWKSPEGTLEKGLQFNRSVDKFASIYFINNEVLPLKNLILELTEDIKAFKMKSNTLSKFRCINKANFSILYRNLGNALYEATKSRLQKENMTNTEHLDLWKDACIAWQNMSEIAKTLENRNNLSAFFKKSMPVLRLFNSYAMPILKLELKENSTKVLEIVEILQKSTRFLQTQCVQARERKKDVALMNKVPQMSQLLETLRYELKAALVANNCSEAFCIKTYLKNKYIYGDVIHSSEESE